MKEKLQPSLFTTQQRYFFKHAARNRLIETHSCAAHVPKKKQDEEITMVIKNRFLINSLLLWLCVGQSGWR